MKINLIIQKKKKLIAKKMKGIASYRAQKCIQAVDNSDSFIN